MNYGKSFYSSGTIQRWTYEYLKRLPKDVTILMCVGSSGCSIASAMIAKCRKDLKTFIVRKEGENSHSSGYTGYYPYGHEVVCIVDDFIDTGSTMIHLINYARSEKINVKYILLTAKKGEKYSEVLRAVKEYNIRLIKILKEVEE